MDKVEFPSRTCREAVWSPMAQAYPCELVDLHPGPHASLSVMDSVVQRDAYEERHPDWRDGIGSMDTMI